MIFHIASEPQTVMTLTQMLLSLSQAYSSVTLFSEETLSSS
jgi:hypothetical protein